MEIQRKSIKVSRVQSALLVLGINTFKGQAKNNLQRAINKRKPCSLWLRDDLHYILKDAKINYHELAKQYHPDKNGSQEQMLQINQAWEFVERTFKVKGLTLN